MKEETMQSIDNENLKLLESIRETWGFKWSDSVIINVALKRLLQDVKELMKGGLKK